MSDMLEIVNGISQAISMKHDGGDKFGLEREKETSMYDKRDMDGFGVSFHGNYITVKYHLDLPIEKFHGIDYQTEIKQKMTNLVDKIESNFKSVKKKSLKLKKCGDLDTVVQTPNRRRVFVNAAQTYEFDTGEKENKMESSFNERSDRYAKHWLKMMKK